ncbi:MAG TPA: hypothetical protein VMS55_00035 [Myxococcota bacterium]|nr:hypothetical protein [Myxococcota bacterium]
MSEGAAGEPGADAQRRALRRTLGAGRTPLRIVAERVLGAETRIDLVGIGPDGETRLVLIAEPGRELEAVARGLAHCAFVEVRLPDWLQLAPDLGARPEAGVRALVLAAGFGAEAFAAAAAIPAGRIELAVCHFERTGPELRASVHPVAAVAPAPASPVGPPEPPAARFRTGLSDADLGVSVEEQSALEAPFPRENIRRSAPTEIL